MHSVFVTGMKNLTSCFSWNSDMSMRMKPCNQKAQHTVYRLYIDVSVERTAVQLLRLAAKFSHR